MQLDFPKIDSVSAPWQTQLNKRFQQVATANADSFKQFIAGFEAFGLRELSSSFQVHTNNTNLLAISQRFIWAVPGTSILLGEVVTTNYDRASQQQLSLSDCFEGEAWQNQLVKAVNQQIIRLNGAGVCREMEFADLTHFSIEKTGIRFFLDAYTGSHACQQIEIILSFDQAKGLIKDQVKVYFGES